MRSAGTIISTSVQADKQGPSITTRSPEAFTRSNRAINGPTCPPGLARMRTSARTGSTTAHSAAATTIILMTAIRMRGSLVSTALPASYAEICGKVSSSVRTADAGVRECRHPDMAGQRGARQQDRHACARRLAEPHVKVEQRRQLQFAQEIAVAGFGRDVPGAAMIARGCIETRQRQH